MSFPFLHPKTNVEKIVFHSNRSGNSQIYIMNTDGSGIERLTTNSAEDLCPVISPSGTKIAFVSNRDGNSKIYVMSIDGTDQHRLTDTPNEEDGPSWSKDESKIYFRMMIGDERAICVASTDGSDSKQICVDKNHFMPHASPDGTSILYNSTRESRFEIWVMASDGSNPRRIAPAIH